MIPAEWTAGGDAANARADQWRAHREAVHAAAAVRRKPVTSMRCGQCPEPKRRADPPADVVRVRDLGWVMRSRLPTHVVDLDSGGRMDLHRVKDLGVARDQVVGYLLGDPAPWPSDVPTLWCRKHGPIVVDAGQLLAAVKSGTGYVSVDADGRITAV